MTPVKCWKFRCVNCGRFSTTRHRAMECCAAAECVTYWKCDCGAPYKTRRAADECCRYKPGVL